MGGGKEKERERGRQRKHLSRVSIQKNGIEFKYVYSTSLHVLVIIKESLKIYKYIFKRLSKILIIRLKLLFNMAEST